MTENTARALPVTGIDFHDEMQRDPDVAGKMAALVLVRGDVQRACAAYQAWMYNGYQPTEACFADLLAMWRRERDLLSEQAQATSDLHEACIAHAERFRARLAEARP